MAFCVWINSRLAYQFHDLAMNQPIRVVPGAAAGVYAPGLTNENVLNAIRYVQQLGANITTATVKSRLEELERFCSPSFLPKFRAERDKRLEEIGQQSQSRLFVRDGDEGLVRDDKQIYHYTVTGPWEIRSSSVLMSEIRHQFHLQFIVGTPDKENPYGIQLLGYDVVQLDSSKRNGIADASGRGQQAN